MKIISVFIFVLMSVSYAFAELNENCKQAGGTPPGVKQATKSPPPDSVHAAGILSPGPISCFCGKKVYTPRPGDSCVDGIIHPGLRKLLQPRQRDLAKGWPIKQPMSLRYASYESKGMLQRQCH